MHVLQFSQSIDSPSEIYVAFQGDPLLCPSLSPRQEGHCDTRVLSQMPSDPPEAPSLPCTTHIHRHCRTIRKGFNKIPHSKPELLAAPTLLFSTCYIQYSFFFLLSAVSVNLRSKCVEKDWRRSEDDEEEGKLKERGVKEKKKKAQVENKTTQLVHLCHCKPVKSPCFCEGACEQNALWSLAAALYCGITTATTKPLQKCAGRL